MQTRRTFLQEKAKNLSNQGPVPAKDAAQFSPHSIEQIFKLNAKMKQILCCLSYVHH